MVMTASLAAATAAGLATTLAPAAASGVVFAAVRFHTVTWCPTSMSRAAMALPMAPSPATPICIRYSPDASVPARTLCDRWAARKPLARGGRMPYRLATQSDNEDGMVLGKKGAVGIVGLGIMGGSFAQNLVAAGWRVIGYDIAPERRRAMARAGIEIA